ncbi:MAG TPA: cupin domain-containing protein [Acidobacteriaceae bacterium]|jgi:predicted cupin superfamily sugar epimerase|nr:cupin domain-containing protein [Acidobacteriaceae bacterium]
MNATPTLTAAEIKHLLQLQPHPREGGWFVRTYESAETLSRETFSDRRYDGPRRTCTAIYYLLEPDTFSEMHLLASDELFHHYAGDAVEMLQLHPGGRSERLILGKYLRAGHRPQLLVPRGVWQGSRLLPAISPQPQHGWALLGCTVSPGFEFADYRASTYADLLSAWPAEASLLRALTRS